MTSLVESTIVALIDRSLFTEMGGPGSGNWSHRGRKGKRGGSAPRGAKGRARVFGSEEEARDWGEKTFAGWRNSLNEEERRAFLDYTSGETSGINRFLRTGEDTTGKAEAAVEALDSALARSVIPENITLYHGGAPPQPGAYTSGSLSKQRAEWFGTVTEIQIPAGTRGAYISFREWGTSTEIEVLLPRDTSFSDLGGGQLEATRK